MHIAYKCILLFSLPSLLSIQNVHARAVNVCWCCARACVRVCARWLSSNILNFSPFFSAYILPYTTYTVCLTNKPRLLYNGCTKNTHAAHTTKHKHTHTYIPKLQYRLLAVNFIFHEEKKMNKTNNRSRKRNRIKANITKPKKKDKNKCEYYKYIT